MTTPLDLPPPPPPLPTTHRPAPRLSLPFALRLPLLTSTGLLLGFSLGGTLGGHKSGLIFRAENAHRAPTTARGWYFYHKSKNYRIAQGAVREGAKLGARLAAWVAVFVVCEDAVDRLRGCVDAGSSLVAALAVAGGVSGGYGLSYGLAVRAARKALLVGAAFGLAQDAIRAVKGQGGGVFEYLGLANRRE
ncbi:hypothetical protein FN846DRAFT_131539 [Sphaerosporella brunnea]|uniref:Tim17/Tim22/Tim23/Pmp24 family-domain-containing protein n=1 Tax=Sphaerosporella brunnea TaxID=1250544 RepID=A0A5J5F917_9PEZI|nr:hypothetical protein FN846DRAFT_131539 [Sphaerosporella brunnea]